MNQPKLADLTAIPWPNSRSLCIGTVMAALALGPNASGMQSVNPSTTATAGAQSPIPAQPRPPKLFGQVVRSSSGQPIANARVTIFRPDLSFFKEVRTSANGSFVGRNLLAGSFKMGVAAPGFQYAETDLTLAAGNNQALVALDIETEVGSWAVIGNTLPEVFDATDIAALRPDGYVVFCHDTQAPIFFHPGTGDKFPGPSSSSEQGCMNTTLLADGSLLFVGGQDGSAPGNFQDAISWVKRLRPANAWQDLADMNAPTGRWYPGLARLNDGRSLVMGGGTAPSAVRTNTCEIFDPTTLAWTNTGDMGSAVEFPSVALLLNGKVLRTWGTIPQLYDVGSGTWSDTGQFANPARGFPGHSDHSMLVLTDGRALIVGTRAPQSPMTEYYDQNLQTWSNGTSPSLVRSQSEVVYLPNGEVFVGGGDIGTLPAGGEPELLGIVRRCDLLDPSSGSWRRIPDMLAFREYHAVTLLIPDGRVITTGGTRIKFQVGPTTSDIEAYSPPYLSRGVRPNLTLVSAVNATRGSSIDLTVFPATQLTGAVLMGVQSTTHWVDGGINRRVELNVSQAGAVAQVDLPLDPDLLPVGWYMLFGMVDDIPSEAVFVRIDP